VLLQSTLALADNVSFRAGVSAEEARSRMWLFDSRVRPAHCCCTMSWPSVHSFTFRLFSDMVLIPLRLHASGLAHKVHSEGDPALQKAEAAGIVSCNVY